MWSILAMAEGKLRSRTLVGHKQDTRSSLLILTVAARSTVVTILYRHFTLMENRHHQQRQPSERERKAQKSWQQRQMQLLAASRVFLLGPTGFLALLSVCPASVTECHPSVIWIIYYPKLVHVRRPGPFWTGSQSVASLCLLNKLIPTLVGVVVRFTDPLTTWSDLIRSC